MGRKKIVQNIANKSRNFRSQRARKLQLDPVLKAVEFGQFFVALGS